MLDPGTQQLSIACCCREWLQAHIDDVKYLGKPLVLEEFGKAVGEPHLPVPSRCTCMIAVAARSLLSYPTVWPH